MRSRRNDDSQIEEKINYSSVGVQVDPESAFFTAEEIAQCESDEIIPWDSPSLQAPLCSWSMFPSEPSSELKVLVDIFSNDNHGNAM